MADVDHEPVSARKGFSFVRLPNSGVRVRVKVGEVDMNAGFETLDPIGTPVYREVELSAAEWVDVVLAVSADPSGLYERALWLHMGPPPAEEGV